MKIAHRAPVTHRPASHAAPPTVAELKKGLAQISESGFEDAHPLKGNLPTKVGAAFEKLEPGQTDVAEFYQVSVKGHAMYASVQWLEGTPNRVHVFDASGRARLNGTFTTDGGPITWK
jgi:hypothetical protein